MSGVDLKKIFYCNLKNFSINKISKVEFIPGIYLNYLKKSY